MRKVGKGLVTVLTQSLVKFLPNSGPYWFFFSEFEEFVAFGIVAKAPPCLRHKIDGVPNKIPVRVFFQIAIMVAGPHGGGTCFYVPCDTLGVNTVRLVQPL